jgi:hypothetical protein
MKIPINILLLTVSQTCGLWAGTEKPQLSELTYEHNMASRSRIHAFSQPCREKEKDIPCKDTMHVGASLNSCRDLARRGGGGGGG